MRPSPEHSRLLPLLALVGALAVAGCDSQASGPAASDTARPVRVETVRLESADNTVRYAAVVRPRIEADLAFRVTGKVIERRVEAGTRVSPGMVLARLDPADLDLQLRAATAQLAAAQANAVNARGDFQRYAQLRQGEWATKQEYDRRRAVMESAEARVRELEAQLRVARNGTDYASLVADADGIVTAAMVEPGQVVAAGQPVFRLARLEALEVAAHIPEMQVAGLADAAMKVEFWALPGVTVTGRLRELSPSADPTTRTYEARVSLIEAPPAVQLGMTATLAATRPRDGQVARLPLATLTQQDKQPAVWVVTPTGDGVELRPVTVGGYTGERVIITAGLTDGEQVVTAGVHKLDQQQKVRVWTPPQR